MSSFQMVALFWVFHGRFAGNAPSLIKHTKCELIKGGPGHVVSVREHLLHRPACIKNAGLAVVWWAAQRREVQWVRDYARHRGGRAERVDVAGRRASVGECGMRVGGMNLVFGGS